MGAADQRALGDGLARLIAGNKSAVQQPDPVSQQIQPVIVTPERRRERLSQTVQSEVVAGWRVQSQGEFEVVLVKGKRPNHVLHLILTLVTFGLWLIIWIILAISMRESRNIISVDEFGNVRNQHV